MKSSRSLSTQEKANILANVAGFTRGFFTFLLVITLFVHLTSLQAWSAQVTLAWDPITEPDVTGYKLYIGPTSGNYTQSIDVGTGTYDGTAVSYTVPDMPVGLYYFVVTFYDTYGNESEYSNEISTAITADQLYTLSQELAGTGSGTVTVGNNACNGNCSLQVAAASEVTLRATPAEYSVFSGWSGACAGSGNCSLTMTGGMAVIAEFDLDIAHSVRIAGGTNYNGISKAYSDAPSGARVEAWGIGFTESLVLDQDKTVTLGGGYNSTYTDNSGQMTTVNGTVTVKSGAVVVENLIVN
jgi:hypothetical protein